MTRIAAKSATPGRELMEARAGAKSKRGQETFEAVAGNETS